MSALAKALREAIGAWRSGRLDVEGLSSWASEQTSSWLADSANRYSYREDVTLEALGLVAAASEEPEPEVELEAAQSLLRGETPFHASRLLLLDPEWIDASPIAAAAQLVRDAGSRIERGADWSPVVAQVGSLLAREAEALGGGDYVELVVIESAAICEDLRFAVDGAIEVLGKGRPRIDASILAERLASLGQVLRGERPLRVLVRGRGADQVQVVLSY